MADVIDAIIAEALGEGPAGMAAVAHVINTRAQQTGKTPEQIINEAGQFSGVSNPGSSVAQSMKDPAVRAQVQQIWNGVTSGQIPNPYPGGDYFHTPQVSPDWAGSYTKLGQTGNHIFYSSGKPIPDQSPRTAPTPADPIMRPATQMASTTPPSFDWSKYATGGAASRPDSFTGLNDPFSQALQEMLLAAPPEVQIGISSAYRSPELQAKLWEDALAKYGSPEAARKWVAPPGNSQHNHGNAGDLKFMTPAAREWAHANAGKYGLAFPLSNEPWHIELGTARSGAPNPAVGAINSAAPSIMRPGAPPKPGGIMSGIGAGIGNLLGYAGQQAAPIMRGAQSVGQQAAPSIMKAALGSIAGRSAIIDPMIARVFSSGAPLPPNMMANAQKAVSQSGDTSVGNQAEAAAVRASADSYRNNRR